MGVPKLEFPWTSAAQNSNLMGATSAVVTKGKGTPKAGLSVDHPTMSVQSLVSERRPLPMLREQEGCPKPGYKGSSVAHVKPKPGYKGSSVAHVKRARGPC